MSSPFTSEPPSESPQRPSGSEKVWSMVCHLSSFIAAPLLLPLVVYLAMKGESEFATRNAAEALNFHISLFLYSVLCVPLMFIGVGFVLLGVLWLLSLVCSVLAALKASDGYCYRYPLTIRLIG